MVSWKLQREHRKVCPASHVLQPLNEHLSQYVVVDDQSCACGHVCENNKHILLECHP